MIQSLGYGSDFRVEYLGLRVSGPRFGFKVKGAGFDFKA